MAKNLLDLMRLVTLANEHDGNEASILRFSDPDGVLSGKSGYSFGESQFDTQNNPQAIACLKECGFTPDEIHGIVTQTIDVKPLAAKLVAHRDVVERYDEAQLKHCLEAAARFNERYKIPITDTACLLAQGDYINQYGSMGAGFAAYLQTLKRPVIAEDILDFKITVTKYGRAHPKDCRRRYANLMRIVEETV